MRVAGDLRTTKTVTRVDCAVGSSSQETIPQLAARRPLGCTCIQVLTASAEYPNQGMETQTNNVLMSPGLVVRRLRELLGVCQSWVPMARAMVRTSHPAVNNMLSFHPTQPHNKATDPTQTAALAGAT